MRRVQSTPMGPYIELMERMTQEEKQIVVTFLTESMREQSQQAETPKNNAEIIREKYKTLKISPEIQRLRGCLKLTEEESEDERSQYILGL